MAMPVIQPDIANIDNKAKKQRLYDSLQIRLGPASSQKLDEIASGEAGEKNQKDLKRN